LSPVFRHGSLRLYLLRLLDEEPRHGYEVIRLLRDRFMGVYSPSPGTIYPRLARLEEEGLVTHDEVDGRKVYRITEAGRDELRSRSDELDELEEELSASVNDIVREVREDVRQTVRSLREELTWAARESHRTGREMSAEAREQARQARDEAREHAKQTRDETLEQTRQARDEALEQAKQARAEVKELARQAREQARQQARRAPGPAQAGPENPWEQATDETEAGQPAGTPGQDTAQRVREHARWLREEAQRVREESPEPAGAGGYRDRIRDEAAARFTGGEQDWDSAGGGGRPGWTDWPGRRGWEDWARMRGGRRSWGGAVDFGTLKDLERMAVQFSTDLRKLAMASTASGENVITDLRAILEEALERVKTEIFRSGPGTAAEPGSTGSGSTGSGTPAAGPEDSQA
jgi:DNA-binding PadR family transcriptional regulator